MYENTAAWGGAMVIDGSASAASIVNCTVAFNSATDLGIIMLVETPPELVIEHTVISHSLSGEAIYPMGAVTLSCCDIFGNEGGDWILGLEEQLGVRGNICEDPLYCDPDAGDLTLQECSPCAPFSPPNPECDLIGAWPVGCGGGSPAIESTWGAVKALFRPERR